MLPSHLLCAFPIRQILYFHLRLLFSHSSRSPLIAVRILVSREVCSGFYPSCMVYCFTARHTLLFWALFQLIMAWRKLIAEASYTTTLIEHLGLSDRLTLSLHVHNHQYIYAYPRKITLDKHWLAYTYSLGSPTNTPMIYAIHYNTLKIYTALRNSN